MFFFFPTSTMLLSLLHCCCCGRISYRDSGEIPPLLRTASRDCVRTNRRRHTTPAIDPCISMFTTFSNLNLLL